MAHHAIVGIAIDENHEHETGLYYNNHFHGITTSSRKEAVVTCFKTKARRCYIDEEGNEAKIFGQFLFFS